MKNCYRMCKDSIFMDSWLIDFSLESVAVFGEKDGNNRLFG